MARGLKFWIYEVEGLYYVAKIKVLINCEDQVQLALGYKTKSCHVLFLT